eukprot:scaffold4462_cov119-Skeletonema_dohrnii-CCMP3373.AAC.4
MGRKRNQGKARKAAKAKARAAAEERNQATDGQQQSLAEQMQRMQIGDTTECWHGLDRRFYKVDYSMFMDAFKDAFSASVSQGADISNSLVDAHTATIIDFAEVWNDSAKMESAMSILLWSGTQQILDGEYDLARLSALFFRYFEQYIAAALHQSQALMNWPKIDVISNGRGSDIHSLVKFFRKRIPCKCLDEKYDEVKHITKMGICYNPECRLNLSGEVERSKTMYCSRCRSVTYCSHECHKASWSGHKEICNHRASIIAEFDANTRSIDNAP